MDKKCIAICYSKCCLWDYSHLEGVENMEKRMYFSAFSCGRFKIAQFNQCFLE